MDITSIGYGGTIDYAEWAVLTDHLGAGYSVFGPDAFKAQAGAAAREVILPGGRASAAGILDDTSGTASLIGGPVSGGSGTRYDMIALRRTWESGGTGQTTPVLIPGGTARAVPAHQSSPGVAHDQPLWLVRFAAGQNAPQEFIDLRVWHGHGGIMYANDPLVLEYLTDLGTMVRIGSSLFVREMRDGNPAWRDLNDATNMISIRRGVPRTIQFLLDLVLDAIQAASSSPKAGSLMQYDAAGRASVNDPTQPTHIATRGWLLRHLDNITDKTARGNSIVMRGDGGQIATARPLVGGHAANVDWVGDYVTGRITPLAERANNQGDLITALTARVKKLEDK